MCPGGTRAAERLPVEINPPRRSAARHPVRRPKRTARAFPGVRTAPVRTGWAGRLGTCSPSSYDFAPAFVGSVPCRVDVDRELDFSPEIALFETCRKVDQLVAFDPQGVGDYPVVERCVVLAVESEPPRCLTPGSVQNVPSVNDPAGRVLSCAAGMRLETSHARSGSPQSGMRWPTLSSTTSTEAIRAGIFSNRKRVMPCTR